MEKWLVFSLLLCLLAQPIRTDWPDPFDRTTAQVWPQPAVFIADGSNFTLDPRLLRILPNFECDIVKSAIAGFNRKMKLALSHSPVTTGDPIELRITVKDTRCPVEPQLGMDEDYDLQVNQSGMAINSLQAWGVVRGLETLSQLVFYAKDGLRMRSALISDHPRFAHRGLLLDTSRHFFSLTVIKALIELMAQNKLNVFHWHLSDNEAFPFASSAYPEMADGAYSKQHIYSAKDIKEVVSFARLRGVRVLPEVDTPGHARSWGKAIPSVVSRCFDKLGQETLDKAILDPTRQGTYDVITALFKPEHVVEELFSLYPDGYFHLGGDEVDYWIEQCWNNNKNITDYMKLWGMTSTRDLEQHFFSRLILHLTARDMPRKNFIVWQEVLDTGVRVDGVIGHVWKGNTQKEQMAEVAKIVKAGHFAILSSCWYLDRISWNIDWKDYYECDPQDLENVTSVERNRVLGGEAAMWGEMVDGSNAIPRIFPRASAVAEVLWSSREFTKGHNGSMVWPRLLEWQCRMAERGFPVQPGNGPGFCPYEYQPALPDLNY